MKSHSSLTNLGLALGITHAMRHAAIFRAVVMLTLSCCRRSGEFKTQAELGQPIVRAIEDDHNQMGSYPASLADLTLKYLTTAPDIPDKRQHKFIGWDYCIITNRAAVSYSLRYCMGKGGVEYEPPDWFGNDEGNRKVVLSNR